MAIPFIKPNGNNYLPWLELRRVMNKAKAFVEDRLKGIEFVVIKTYKTDMYGRYVVDVFYHPTIKKKEEVYEKGFFLNMELLTEGLADVMP